MPRCADRDILCLPQDPRPRKAVRSMKPDSIPAPTIMRLSLYLRRLDDCSALGIRTISSKQLGETLSLTDAQVRKDLAYFGPFGHPGIGYRVADLAQRIRSILGTDKTWRVILVGAGNLGRALAAYRGFGNKGFELVAVCDADSAKVGRPMPGRETLVIHALHELAVVVAQYDVKLGILAVPAAVAQEVADQMIAAGVKGILNFAPLSLSVPQGVAVSGVDLSVQLEQLSFRVGGLLAAVQEHTDD